MIWLSIAITSTLSLKGVSVRDCSDVFWRFGERIHRWIRFLDNRLCAFRRHSVLLVSSFYFFFLSPTLQIQRWIHIISALKIQPLVISRVEEKLFLGKELGLACVSLGSSELEFFWFKDNAPLMQPRSGGSVWRWPLPKNSKDEYTDSLHISSLEVAHAGKRVWPFDSQNISSFTWFVVIYPHMPWCSINEFLFRNL